MTLRYLALQTIAFASPRDVPAHLRGLLTGDGTLVPVSCDGFYATAESAQEVADYINEKEPRLRTMVV